MTWPVLAFLLTAVFALGFHLGQRLGLVEAEGSSDLEPRAREALSHEAALFRREIARHSFRPAARYARHRPAAVVLPRAGR